MIRAWVFDVRITSFMVVGCYRSNENDKISVNKDETISCNKIESKDDGKLNGNNDTLDKMIQAIEQVHKERNINVCKIHVDNLSLEHVNELLSRSLSETSQRTHALAKVVYGKTHGNIFFTIQLLINLAQQDLLRYDISTLKWEWEDEDEIQEPFISFGQCDRINEKQADGNTGSTIFFTIGSMLGCDIFLGYTEDCFGRFPRK